jgi:predicted metal-dependent peptidase
MNDQHINEDASYSPGWDVDKKGKKWEDYDTIKMPNGEIIDMNQLLDDMASARAALTHIAPAFGGLISKLRTIYTFRFKTQATDGYNYFVNPYFTSKLSFTAKVAVMAHEVMHCMLNHNRRGRELNHKRCNIAMDYEVNITLVDMDVVSLKVWDEVHGYCDPKYSGWGFEKIYPEVKNDSSSQDNEQQGKGGQKSQQKQKGQGSGGGGKQNYSDAYKAGWKKAIEDYKAGKLKI